MSNKYDMHDIIKSTFMNFKIVVKKILEKSWATMSTEEKYAAGRSLVYMESVAKSPDKYFSRLETVAAWRARAKNARNVDIKQPVMPYSIVQSPSDIVCHSAHPALLKCPNLFLLYSEFCRNVLDWEYGRTTNSASVRGKKNHIEKKILKMYLDIKNQAMIAQSNCFMRPLRKCVRSLSR